MIDIHPSVNKFFGDIVLDGEIWYLILCCFHLFLYFPFSVFFYFLFEITFILYRFLGLAEVCILRQTDWFKQIFT